MRQAPQARHNVMGTVVCNYNDGDKRRVQFDGPCHHFIIDTIRRLYLCKQKKSHWISLVDGTSVLLH